MMLALFCLTRKRMAAEARVVARVVRPEFKSEYADDGFSGGDAGFTGVSRGGAVGCAPRDET